MKYPSGTPIMKIETPETLRHNIRLFVKREDLNHPFISGNKYWKLLYNMAEAEKTPSRTVLTFGGAFSNHLYATAAAAKEAGLNSIGIVRGEETSPLNSTLTFVRECGMRLSWVSREKYRMKDDPEFIRMLHQTFGDFYLIPEGGSNLLAVKGCAEFAERELMPFEFDHLFIPAGTGGTMAGMICGLKGEKKITGVSVLKNGDFLNEDISGMVLNFSGKNYGNWNILTSYHHGGYAKVPEELRRFIVTMRTQHNLPLDHVYTGKMMWALLKEIENGKFQEGTKILAIHTGGLQR